MMLKSLSPRRIALLAVSAALLGVLSMGGSVLAGDAAKDAFVSGFEDLPLMPGLSQAAGAGTVFDTPSGRVVEAFADGPVAATAVQTFYAETLPHLGWRQISPRRYSREGEVLDLEITPQTGTAAGTRVRFYLSPL